eukprot:CAMPEP_0119151302 /NCGR_PEP_ID=MMETSP1310-20130426/46142_1 /TAXON_ID=464262 /ORGANISM="Genus nov. species nov., Strain RCC2339" /LENGTH=401 /DNA_ID=CAMNT_0007143569 /DNA_START=44 /DNA_END=1245 /DNA_ORIENTATION=+
MRAAVLTRYGSNASALEVRKVKKPTVSGDRVLVRVCACAISQLDLTVRHGGLEDVLHLRTREKEFIPGYEISGIVAKIGPNVQGWFQEGDEVVGFLPIDAGAGGCAEFIAEPYYFFVKKPSVVTHAEAAGCIVPALRAYGAMVYKMRLAAGQSILILDGASEAGHVQIQLALHWGARVLATVSSPEEHQYLKELSSDIVVIDTSTANLPAAVERETDGQGVDFILDNAQMEVPLASVLNQSSTDAGRSGGKEETPPPGTPAFVSNVDLLSPRGGVVAPAEGQDALGDGAGGEDRESHPFAPACEAEPKRSTRLPVREAVLMLAPHGAWVTGSDVFLSPSDCYILHRKSASVAFLCEQTWVLAGYQVGRYLHILQDCMDLLAQEKIKAKITGIYKLEKIQQA